MWKQNEFVFLPRKGSDKDEKMILLSWLFSAGFVTFQQKLSKDMY